MKTKLIYTKLPVDQIHFLNRKEFHNEEKKFKDSLMASIKKHGILEPVYAEYGHDYGPKIKVTVGNNRMAVAQELGIKEVPIIVNIYTPDTFTLEGRELKTDEEIRSLFKLKDQLQIRRDEHGRIDQIMPPEYQKVVDAYI
jgi:ParB-like chromosome segregation protein Spo0J